MQEITFEVLESDSVIEFDVVSNESKVYTGEYMVIPKVVEQVLKTKGRGMTGDVTVKEIPTHEVTNDYGTTMIIGGLS